VSTSVIHRYRFDDLRRFAAALGSASGLVPLRALALASHLLWFDAAGAGLSGIATLPEWLEALASGAIDPATVGRLRTERAALAIFDGENGIPPLVLARAAELAVEKARELGAGLVRVAHVGRIGSAAAVAAGIAIGPNVGFLVGPDRTWSLACPSAQGLPIVIDSVLAAENASHGKTGTPASRAGARKHPEPAMPPPCEGLAAWAEMLAPEGSWLVAAIAIANLEPLATFHERLGAWSRGLAGAPGWLLPDVWDAHRREVCEHGVAIPAPVWKKLKQWSQRLAVEIPNSSES
jgi:LDH2 family malate/lactate/ureidoglycolate dehydrogenase